MKLMFMLMLELMIGICLSKNVLEDAISHGI